MNKVATPDVHSIEDVCAFLQVDARQTLKTLVVLGEEVDGTQPLVALVLRGDHQLNEIKAAKLEGVQSPLTLAGDAQIQQQLSCAPGSIGPVGLGIDIIVDRDAAVLADFVCGANDDGYHLSGVNWERDASYTRVADLRNVVEGDASPDGQGSLVIKRGIEVGHIFQLGNKYSKAMNAAVLDETGRMSIMEMGCYGIGVTRIVAACIEQCHDDKGIIWPDNIAPFQVALIALNAHKAPQVAEVCEQLYQELTAAGVEVLLDDRDKKTSPGVKFADMELIGIPHRLVISDRHLESGSVEYKQRRAGEPELVALDQILPFLRQRLKLNA